MRRDQVLFLAGGVALGVIIGLLFGVLASRPDLIGAAPARPAAPAAAPPAGEGDPHADSGMESVNARLTELRTRLERNPSDPEALIGLGELFLEANMRERALDHLDRGVAAAAQSPVLLTRAAAGLLEAGEPEKSLAAARRAMDLDRGLPGPAEVATVAALRGLGDVDAAEIALNELDRRAPGVPVVPELRAELDRVRRVLQDGREKPGDYAAQVALGNQLFDTRRWSESERAYRRALAIKDGDPNVITDLGIVVYRQGRPADAIGLFERAMKIDAGHWQAALNGVVVSLETGDAKQAREWLDRLKSVNPQRPEIPQFERQLAALGT